MKRYFKAITLDEFLNDLGATKIVRDMKSVSGINDVKFWKDIRTGELYEQSYWLGKEIFCERYKRTLFGTVKYSKRYGGAVLDNPKWTKWETYRM